MGLVVMAMTPGEQNVLDALVQAWNAYADLPVEHADDTSDFRYGLHILQRQIMARPTRREMRSSS